MSHRTPRLRLLARLAGLALAAGTAAAHGAAPLPPETLTVQPMPPRSDHAIYAIDLASPIDTHLIVYDIDRKKMVTQWGAGFLRGVAR